MLNPIKTSITTVLLGGLLFGCAHQNTSIHHYNSNINLCQKAMLSPLPNGVLRAEGQGASEAEALRIALANIAVQMQVSVQSTSDSQQRKIGNKSDQQFLRQITSSSEHVFSDYSILCKSQHHVVVSFDNRPLQQRIQAKLKQDFPLGWQLTGPKWLKNSPAIKGIFDYGNGDEVKLNLFKFDSFWYLALNDVQIKLRDNEWRFLYVLPNQTDQANKMASVWLANEYGQKIDNTLTSGDEFRFELKASKNFKFVSLIYIQEDGAVYPVRLNQAFQNQIPKAPKIFSAETESDLAIDDYLLIFSNQLITPPASNKSFVSWLNIADKHKASGIRVLVKKS